MTAALKAAEYAPGDYEKIARSMAHAMKSADGLVRLVEFASGRPDSRADAGTDWLGALTQPDGRSPISGMSGRDSCLCSASKFDRSAHASWKKSLTVGRGPLVFHILMASLRARSC
jgi:hypothetical protein